MTMIQRTAPLLLHVVAMYFVSCAPLRAQEAASTPRAASAEAPSTDAISTDDAPAQVLSPDEWQRVDRAVERALVWLAAQQKSDGSFPTIPLGQPGVTSLCAMAFMAHGHVPREGPYGARLDRAVDYILSCPRANGLISLVGPEGPLLTRSVSRAVGTPAAYNHAISSLALGELYGMSGAAQTRRLQGVLDRSVAVSLEMQQWPKDKAVDAGGWRYIDEYTESDADLSVTGWYLMSLRSARNAGFDVPKQPIDDAVDYVRRTFNDRTGTFDYLIGPENHRSRAMAGAGILAFGHAGFHNSPQAARAGQWLLEADFDVYNDNSSMSQFERYHYSIFTCCQGMYQLGGRPWELFFPRAVHVLLVNQQASGAWKVENHRRDAAFGDSYTTALVVLALGAPNQLLPIFQR